MGSISGIGIGIDDVAEAVRIARDDAELDFLSMGRIACGKAAHNADWRSNYGESVTDPVSSAISAYRWLFHVRGVPPCLSVPPSTVTRR